MQKILVLCLFSLCMAFQTDKPAYLLYDHAGQPTDYRALLRAAEQADVVFFGELHNNPICHWLQLQLAKDLMATKGLNLVLAAEMFEADDQLVLNEFLAGQVKEANFEKEAKLWNNYATDYKPLLALAKAGGLAVVASNVPRRYASMVASGGWAALEPLTPEAKSLMAPLPIEVDLGLPGYKNMLTMMGGHGGSAQQVVLAQALKDATMAHRIAQAWQKGRTVLHFNGAYHSDNYEGIIWYLKKYQPGLRVATISSVEQDEVGQLGPEAKGKADFIICIPADMTKTY